MRDLGPLSWLEIADSPQFGLCFIKGKDTSMCWGPQNICTSTLVPKYVLYGCMGPLGFGVQELGTGGLNPKPG